MGTGKTTAGKLLSKELGYDFVDTDDLIMSRCGKTVALIFETEGENSFRSMERELAIELSEREKLVISTGGKMMLDSENCAVLKKNGRIFCSVLSGIYCTIPGTFFMPLATFIAAASRFGQNPKSNENKSKQQQTG